MLDTTQYSNWLEIDSGAIAANVRRLCAIAGRPLMAVVKANGYGHGLVAAAKAAVAGGATWCAVARVEEALALRAGGVDCPVLVLGYTPAEWVAPAAQSKVSLTVYDGDLLEGYAARAQAAGQTLKVHLKVDTGMGRLGFFPGDVPGVISRFVNRPGIQVEGIFTHFARSDEPEDPTTAAQLRHFIPLIEGLRSAGLCPPLVHSANSAGIFYHSRSYFDIVRSGIAIYGLHPSPEAPLPDGFRPALAWKVRLSSVKMLPAGHGVSYGASYTTRAEERIGVIPVGYADGFRRQRPQVVLLHGQRVPVVGRICMDQSMLQLDHLPDALPGDEVVIIGQQGEDAIWAEEVAERWQTNNYEVVCGLAARIPRIYSY